MAIKKAVDEAVDEAEDEAVDEATVKKATTKGKEQKKAVAHAVANDGGPDVSRGAPGQSAPSLYQPQPWNLLSFPRFIRLRTIATPSGRIPHRYRDVSVLSLLCYE